MDLVLVVDKVVVFGFDSIIIYGVIGGWLDYFFGVI